MISTRTSLVFVSIAILTAAMLISGAQSFTLKSSAYTTESTCKWSQSTIYVWNNASTIWSTNGVNDYYPTQNAIGGWNSIDANFNLASGSSSNYNIKITSNSTSGVSWLGVTGVPNCPSGSWSSSTQIYTVLNDYFLNSYNFADRQETVAHELGHGLGLGHESGGNYPEWNLMYPSNDNYNNNHVIAPMRDDINGIISLYGQNLNYKFTTAVTSSGNVYWPGSNGYPVNDVINSGAQGYVEAYDSSVSNLPSSNILILPEIISGSTLYRSAIGVWTSTNPTSNRFATIEFDNDGIKWVSSCCSVSTFYSGTMYSSDEYYLQLLVQKEQYQSSSSITAYAWAYDYLHDTWLGEHDGTLTSESWTSSIHVGFSAWTDSTSNPSSNYWLSQPQTIGTAIFATSPVGSCAAGSFYYSTYGASWEADTRGCSGGTPNYSFFAYPHVPTSGSTLIDFDNMTVPLDGKIVVSGYFMKNDTFYQYGLQQGRSYLNIYILDTSGNIIQSATVMDYTYNNNQWYQISHTFTGLTAGEMVKIAFGRTNAWSTDYKLFAAGSQVLATPG